MVSSFRLPRVEDFFGGMSEAPWVHVPAAAQVASIPGRDAVGVTFEPAATGAQYALLLEFPDPLIVRVRFDPRYRSPGDYPNENSRMVVMDTFDELRATLGPVGITVTPITEAGSVVGDEIVVRNDQNVATARVVIRHRPFSIAVYQRNRSGDWMVVVEDTEPSIEFRDAVEYQIGSEPPIRESQIIKHFRKPPGAVYMGFGERAGARLEKNGRQLTYINFDNWGHYAWYGNGPFEDREPLYNSNPFFLVYTARDDERSVYGVLLDNVGATYMDIGATTPERVKIGTLYDDLDYYLFLGNNTADILQLVTRVVGRARLKPRFMLGYHQACYGYETGNELRRVVDEYRAHQIPLDGLHIDIDIQHRYRMFTVDEQRFPEFPALLREMRGKGVKCSTNITPIISDEGGGYSVYDSGVQREVFIRDERSTGLNPSPPNATLYRGGVHYGADRHTRGVYADLGSRDTRDWWGDQYKFLFDAGLEMVWQDMTTPCMQDNTQFADWRSFPLNLLVTNDATKMYEMVDGLREARPRRTPAALARNLYAYNLVKATYHGLNRLPSRTGLRNFIIARGGFTGMHRFAGLWTGDNVSDWPYLRVNILQCLAGGLSGQPVTGADIGGFSPRGNEKWADPELLVRWTIAGALLPWFRNHYTKKDYAKEFQEPWEYPRRRDRVPENERWLYDLVVPVCRHYIALRYRLMQLLYDALFENTLTGLPIVRPLFVNDDQDVYLFYDKARSNDDQWFVGRDLLVAPILDKQSAANGYGRRSIYLPQGNDWYGFMDNLRPLQTPAAGGSIVDYDASLSAEPGHLPFLCGLYARGGAIIPTVELEQYVGERRIDGKPANPITINIYPAKAGTSSDNRSYRMFEDDGVSRSSAFRPPDEENPEYSGTDPEAQSQYRETRVHHRWTGPGVREVSLTRVHNGYTPALGFVYVAILHDPAENIEAGRKLRGVTLNGPALPVIEGPTPEAKAALLLTAENSCWYYNEDIDISFVKVFTTNNVCRLELAYA